MKKKQKKKTKMNQFNAVLRSRKGVTLVALIAMVVLIVNLVSFSFAWFQPQSVTQKSVGYSYEAQLRPKTCTMSTILGTKVTVHENGLYKDQINYNLDLPSNEIPDDHEISIAAGDTQYFKTEIINSDTVNGTDISLYIRTMPACTVAVTFPSNSVRKVSSATYDYYLIRNAYVKKYVAVDVNGPGLLKVEWFVKNTGNSSITIDLDDLYIVYN